MDFTVDKTIEVDINITIGDIISNLNEYSASDLEKLSDELSFYVEQEDGLFKVETLYDQMKLDATVELYKIFSLEEINEMIKNK